MKSFSIPKNITLYLFKAKNKNIIQLQNQKTSIWFLTKNIKTQNRTITANQNTIRALKNAILNIQVGHKRTLILQGVGFKASIINKNNQPFLVLKISNTKPPIFKIPNDIAITINRQKIHC
jgi:ribosomal protein L6P/L9E